jgi:dienelactone hydrolase
MQFPRITAGVLAGAFAVGAGAATARAQSAGPNRLHDVTAQEVVYAVPGMEKVVLRSDVPFKKIEGSELKLDLYYPPDAKPGGKLPAVVFINGVGDRSGNKLKDWGIYKSWGRLVAASGWIGVNFEARGVYDQSVSDIRDAFAFLRRDAASLGIDADRIAAWVCSGNVTSGLAVLMNDVDPGVRGAVVYYGTSNVEKLRADLPVYFVRAGRDNPRLNAGIDELWKKAVSAGAPWTMVNAPTSQHAFDAVDETDESRRIVRETLDFYRDLFTPPAAAGPPSLAKKALSHWFGGREYPQAAQAYAEYVKAHPDDAVAWMRLGLAQANMKDPAAAGSLEKAVQLGAKTPTDLYNVACGFALVGQREKALDYLDRAVAAGFDDRRLLETDTDLASIRDTDGFRTILGKVKA